MSCKNRDSGLELFRILLMFGIVLLHVCGQGKYKCVWPTNLLRGAVVGFVFISGYFGIRFSLSKLLGLYSLAIFYCLLEPIIGGVLWGETGGYFDAVLDAWRAKEGYWFLHAYAILMTLSPIVEKVFDHKREDKEQCLIEIMPFLFVVFIWSYMTGFPSLSRIVPQPLGITKSESVIVLLGIYLAARAIRFYGVIELVSKRVAIIGFLILAFVVSISKEYLSTYACPIQFVAATLGFCVFYGIKLDHRFEKIVLWVSTSMFGVYLIHTMLYFPGMNNKVYSLINAWRDPLIECGVDKYIACLIVAIAIFASSIIIDALRRLMLNPFKSYIYRLNSVLDSLPSRLANKIFMMFNHERSFGKRD